jgi:thioredoxin
MIRALWNGEVIAESDDTVVVEGNHYFPLNSVRVDVLRPTSTTTVCPWKGRASYYTLAVNGADNRDAAWFYPDPSRAAAKIAGRVAFWKGVTVEDDSRPARTSFFDRFRKTPTKPAAAPDTSPSTLTHDGPAPVTDLTDKTFFDSLDGHATIVDFWAPWCGPCKALHPMFDDLAHRHATDSVHFARVNIDDNPNVASTIGVMSIPTLLLCDLAGNEVDRIVGVPNRQRLAAFVAKAESLAPAKP